MRDIDVLYLVEYVGRELDVACAVKTLARARHGLEVEVLPVQLASTYARRNLRPRVIAVPYSYRLTDSCTRDFLPYWPGCTVFNLAWEELFYTVYAEEKLPHDDFTRQYVQHHAWGEFHREQLAACGVPESHVFVNGQPVYMLYRDPYRQRGLTRADFAAEHGLDPEKRWILFSENYGWAFYPPSRVDALVADGMPRETIEGLMRFCAESLRIVLGWFAALGRAHDVEIIVRPRPATMETEFAAVLEEAVPEPPVNLHVIKQSTAREWILASDVVVSSYSTTLIEAAIAGKSALMVAPLPLPEELHAGWYEHVPQVQDAETFLRVCDKPDEIEGGGDLRRWAEETMLGHGDPIAGLADILARLANPDRAKPALPPRAAFPDEYRRWRALRRPSDSPLESLAALPQGLGSLVDQIGNLFASHQSEYRLDDGQLPDWLSDFVDQQDLFDSRDVDRVTGEWEQLLRNKGH